MKLAFHPATPEKYRDASRLRATPMSFGLDLRIAEFISTVDLHSCTGPTTLYPGGAVDVVFHVAVDTRSMFCEADGGGHVGVAPLIIPRSGLGTAGLTIANSVGLIDADYTHFLRGRLQLASWAASLTLNQGDRVAQLVFMPVLVPQFEIVDSLDDTWRGGFGSTGVA